MKKNLTALLIGLIVLNSVGCASEYRLAKPHGKWVAINQPDKVANTTSSNTNQKTVNSK